MNVPGVSIIIPAWNAERTIGQCVGSALTADYGGPCEVIVVDDWSTDGTRAIAESHGCRVLRTPRNSGPATARNTGAEAAKHEILIFIDADTRLRRDSINEAVRALEEEGVAAVTGIYEPEPINPGFFPAYYAYLKYHAFTSGTARYISAFGAQCGAIRRSLFHQVGGFRPFPWGMDIENDEIGCRIKRCGRIVLSREFRVHHNFPAFQGLLRVFTLRVFWYVVFRNAYKYGETVLMTHRFGWATAALPAAAAACALGMSIHGGTTRSLLLAGSIIGGAFFLCAYRSFWEFCRRRRGVAFAAAAAAASALFAVVITASAAWAYLAVAWARVCGRDVLMIGGHVDESAQAGGVVEAKSPPSLTLNALRQGEQLARRC
ncbi:MAG: glycosyltransferase [Phycisphaerae bacterium]